MNVKEGGPDRFRVSLVQTEVGPDKRANVNRACDSIFKAAEQKPHLIVLPENFSFMGDSRDILAQAETPEGPTLTRLREVARRTGTHLLAGTLKLRFPGHDRLLNTSCLIDPDGTIAATYHKVHVFDARVGGVTYDGSAVEEPGDELEVAEILGVPVGLSVCYDLRFPELFRILALRGSRVVLVPALFTLPTGKDHWEVLLRARAIENQVYIVAPAVCGRYPPNGEWAYGRSMVVDPWGVVIAQAQDHPTTLLVELDLPWIERVRDMLPSLKHRRPEAYRWPEPARA